MSKKISMTIVIASLMLSACSTYSNDLEQKLVRKSEQEKRTVLLQECTSKINENLKPDNKKSTEHSKRMKEICEKMTHM